MAGPPTAYALGYGLGEHDVAVGAVGLGTVLAVVDNHAFAFTVHHSLGELDIVIKRKRTGSDLAQTFEVQFDSSKAEGCTMAVSLPSFGPSSQSATAILWT